MSKIGEKDRAILKELIKKHGSYGYISTVISEIQREVWEEGKEQREAKYRANQIKSKKAKEARKARGEEFKKNLKVGDIVKVSGVRNNGIREILELNDSWIKARHVDCIHTGKHPNRVRTYVKGKYITDHGWDKIQRKLNITLSNDK